MLFNIFKCQFGKTTIQQRYLTATFAFLVTVFLYNMRVALNLVINEMIPPPPASNITGERCEVGLKNVTREKADLEIQNWTETQQSFVRAAFYIGYITSHLPAGACADKFGARIIMLACMAISSIFTLIIPVIIDAGAGWLTVGFTRILVGAGQGMYFPAVSSLLSFWIPAKERGLLVSFAFSGSNIGTVIGNALSGLLVVWMNWRLPFYVYGVSGLILMIPVFVWVWSTPDTHPFVSDAEKIMLSQEIKPRTKKKYPLGKILIDRVVWAQMIGEFGHAWVFFTFNTDLPKYLAQMLGFNIKENGFLSALPSLGMWVASILSGLFNDYLYQTKGIRALTLRRWFTAVGCVIPGIFCVATGYAGCNVTLAVTFLILALTTKGPLYAGLKLNYLDITKNYGGLVYAMVNAFGSIAGFVCPYVLSAITKDFLFSQWKIYFWLSLIVCVICTLVYWFMTDDQRRSWDFDEDEEKQKDTGDNDSSPDDKEKADKNL